MACGVIERGLMFQIGFVGYGAWLRGLSGLVSITESARWCETGMGHYSTDTILVWVTTPLVKTGLGHYYTGVSLDSVTALLIFD